MIQIIGIFLLGLLIGWEIGACDGVSKSKRRLHNPDDGRGTGDSLVQPLQDGTQETLAKRGFWHTAFRTNI
jgi:hypothetical protein